MDTNSESPSEELYRQAYGLHYEDKNPDKALPIYKTIIEQFPESKEASYAHSQIANIEHKPDVSAIGDGLLPWATIEDKVKADFCCSKCAHDQAALKRIAVTGSGLSKLLDIQHNRFLTVSCMNCGSVSLFDLDILEGKDHMGSFLDVLFGG